MQIHMEPTSTITIVNGAPCRLWLGVTEDGTPVHCHVATVSPQTHDPERLEAFDRALKDVTETIEIRLPS